MLVSRGQPRALRERGIRVLKFLGTLLVRAYGMKIGNPILHDDQIIFEEIFYMYRVDHASCPGQMFVTECGRAICLR